MITTHWIKTIQCPWMFEPKSYFLDHSLYLILMLQKNALDLYLHDCYAFCCCFMLGWLDNCIKEHVYRLHVSVHTFYTVFFTNFNPQHGFLSLSLFFPASHSGCCFWKNNLISHLELFKTRATAFHCTALKCAINSIHCNAINMTLTEACLLSVNVYHVTIIWRVQCSVILL